MTDVIQLKKQIEDKIFKNIYFFFGDEDYLIKTYVERIRDFFISSPLAADLNLFTFSEESDLDEVIGAAEKYPQLCEKTVVIVKNSGFLKSDSKKAKLWLRDLPEHSVIIFTEKSGSMLSKVLAREIEKVGVIAEFPFQTTAVLSRWIKQTLDRENKSMTASAISHLAELCGRSMTRIEIELNKLICCSDKAQISVEEVESLVRSPIETKVFSFIDKIMQKDSAASYAMLAEFQKGRELPSLILPALFSQLQLIVMIDDLRQSSSAPPEKFVAPNKKFLIKKLSSGRYNCAKLKHVMSLCSRYDSEIKAGQTEGYTALEVITALLLEA